MNRFAIVVFLLIPLTAFAEQPFQSGIVGKAVAISPCTGLVAGPAAHHSFTVRDGGREVATRFETNKQGSFQVSLRPGIYTISSDAQTGVNACLWPGATLMVASHHFTSLNISCHTHSVFDCAHLPGS